MLRRGHGFRRTINAKMDFAPVQNDPAIDFFVLKILRNSHVTDRFQIRRIWGIPKF